MVGVMELASFSLSYEFMMMLVEVRFGSLCHRG